MPLPDVQITSEAFWLCALVTAILAGGMVWALARRIPRDRFSRLGWPIVIAAGAFWVSYGLCLFALTWESYYAKFLPNPNQRGIGRSVIELLPYPLIGFLLWWLAKRLPGNPVLSFCLLGGLESLPEHLWGIYALDMLDTVPFLEAASPVSVLAFALVEYILYWGSVLSLAMLIENGWRRWTNRARH